MQSIRWKLFTHAVSSRLEDEEIKDLPDHLILPTPALFYLVEHNVMELWEIEALLATVITLPSEPLEKLAELSSDPVNVQAVQIATIFMRTLAICFKLLNACGFPYPRSKVFQYPYFDGKLFQEKYREAKDGATHAELCKNQASDIEIFHKINNILSKGTRS